MFKLKRQVYAVQTSQWLFIYGSKHYNLARNKNCPILKHGFKRK